MLSLQANQRNTAAGLEFDYLLEFGISVSALNKMYDATILLGIGHYVKDYDLQGVGGYIMDCSSWLEPKCIARDSPKAT